MWTRVELKTRAKAMLKASYWKAFLVSLVLLLAGGEVHRANFRFESNSRHELNGFVSSFMPFNVETAELVATTILIASAIALLFISLRIFLGYPLEVGGRKFFIQAARNDVNTNYLGFSFRDERYQKTVKTMLWRGVLNFLWYLLFIIPGIIKSYAYLMVPYILADNPNIDFKRAIEISERMTNGHKFDIWVLELSFLGWYLLGMLAFMVGTVFVMPYEHATKAELYLKLRQYALEYNYCSPEELGFDPSI